MTERICPIPECDRACEHREWCGMHYARWLRWGDPLGSAPPRKRRGCSVPECARPYCAKGYCELHYRRWRNFGDPETVITGNRGGDDVCYEAVHRRLEASRGRARDLACAHCGNPAQDWAYDGNCPNEKLGPNNGRLLAYSTDPDRYMPLCRPCHRRYDFANR